MHRFLQVEVTTKLARRAASARRLSHAKALGSPEPAGPARAGQRSGNASSAHGSAAEDGNPGRGNEPSSRGKLAVRPAGRRGSSDRCRRAGEPRRPCRAALPCPDCSTPARSGRQRAARRSPQGPPAVRFRPGAVLQGTTLPHGRAVDLGGKGISRVRRARLLVRNAIVASAMSPCSPQPLTGSPGPIDGARCSENPSALSEGTALASGTRGRRTMGNHRPALSRFGPVSLIS